VNTRSEHTDALRQNVFRDVDWREAQQCDSKAPEGDTRKGESRAVECRNALRPDADTKFKYSDDEPRDTKHNNIK
jgi:hypothetical protein